MIENIHYIENEKNKKLENEQRKFDPSQFTSPFYKEIDLNNDGRNEKIRVDTDKNDKTFLYINDEKVAKILWRPLLNLNRRKKS
ncbi:MAG: hypothetical protein HY919_06315 [Elusimicrobia bacterium]|nr:hypothetical protein [Elusimicrobiota bacterium]